MAPCVDAQGTPQLLAGDELGHSKQGNNNTYCQDNETTWLDWANADNHLTDFVAGLVALRQRHPGLRHPVWFQGQPAGGSPWPDIEWLQADGRPMHADDWSRSPHCALAALITVGEHGQAPTERLLLIWHAGRTHARFTLPKGHWSLAMDSARGFVAAEPGTVEALNKHSLDLNDARVYLLVQRLHGEGKSHRDAS